MQKLVLLFQKFAMTTYKCCIANTALKMQEFAIVRATLFDF